MKTYFSNPACLLQSVRSALFDEPPEARGMAMIEQLITMNSIALCAAFKKGEVPKWLVTSAVNDELWRARA